MEKEKLLTVRASRQWMERLHAAARMQGETMSGFVRRAVGERIQVVEDSVDEPRSRAEARAPMPEPDGLVGRAVYQETVKPCRHGLAHCRICHRST